MFGKWVGLLLLLDGFVINLPIFFTHCISPWAANGFSTNEGLFGVMCMLLLIRIKGSPNSLIVNERRHIIQTKSFLMCTSGIFIKVTRGTNRTDMND